MRWRASATPRCCCAARQRETPAPPAATATALAAAPVSAAAWCTDRRLGYDIGVALVTVGVGVIVIAPWLTAHDLETMRIDLLDELRPLPRAERGRAVEAAA
jgi:hypothetical protein